ncbi:hypothetical protein V8F06_008039 [Rhypophila decipiens]
MHAMLHTKLCTAVHPPRRNCYRAIRLCKLTCRLGSVCVTIPSPPIPYPDHSKCSGVPTRRDHPFPISFQDPLARFGSHALIDAHPSSSLLPVTWLDQAVGASPTAYPQLPVTPTTPAPLEPVAWSAPSGSLLTLFLAAVRVTARPSMVLAGRQLMALAGRNLQISVPVDSGESQRMQARMSQRTRGFVFWGELVLQSWLHEEPPPVSRAMDEQQQLVSRAVVLCHSKPSRPASPHAETHRRCC